MKEATTLLTPREHQILGYIAQGHTSTYMATKLGVSLKTIEAFRGKILSKLESSNAAQAIYNACQLGLVDDILPRRLALTLAAVNDDGFLTLAAIQRLHKCSFNNAVTIAIELHHRGLVSSNVNSLRITKR